MLPLISMDFPFPGKATGKRPATIVHIVHFADTTPFYRELLQVFRNGAYTRASEQEDFPFVRFQWPGGNRIRPDAET